MEDVPSAGSDAAREVEGLGSPPPRLGGGGGGLGAVSAPQHHHEGRAPPPCAAAAVAVRRVVGRDALRGADPGLTATSAEVAGQELARGEGPVSGLPCVDQGVPYVEGALAG